MVCRLLPVDGTICGIDTPDRRRPDPHASPRAGGNRRAVVAGPRSSGYGFAVAHSKARRPIVDRCTTSRKPRVALSIKRQQSATCGTAGAGRTKAWPEPPRSLAIISTSG